MRRLFDPIRNKSAEIIEWVMSTDEMPKDDSLLFKIRLSVEEIVENVVNYAYGSGTGSLEVITDKLKDGILVITLIDKGLPFNPLEKDDPDITLSAEERNIGGLGIFICKKMMDKIDYKFENGSNILTMEIKIN